MDAGPPRVVLSGAARLAKFQLLSASVAEKGPRGVQPRLTFSENKGKLGANFENLTNGKILNAELSAKYGPVETNFKRFENDEAFEKREKS